MLQNLYIKTLLGKYNTLLKIMLIISIVLLMRFYLYGEGLSIMEKAYAYEGYNSYDEEEKPLKPTDTETWLPVLDDFMEPEKADKIVKVMLLAILFVWAISIAYEINDPDWYKTPVDELEW